MLKQTTVIKEQKIKLHSKIELNYQSIMLELAQNLIRKPSITPSDQGCCDLIGERLQAIGFKLEFMNQNRVSNLWAKRGWPSGGGVCRAY